MTEQFDIPIVMIVYKRLELTKQSFASVRKMKPQKLYIIADGAKNQEEKQKVTEVREYIDSHIDWNCDVHRNYAEFNYGLRYRMPSGMKWVFETEEKAIFIEDDIDAGENFFYYCKELLEYFENDKRVLMISGSNIYPELDCFGEASICFSKFASIWGWACWKRSFELYDVNLRGWQKERRKGDWKKGLTKNAYRFYKYLFDDLQYHWFRTWDYQVTYLMLTGKGLGIVPKYNLVRNIGMGNEDAEHKDDTKELIEKISSIKKKEIEFPMCYPKEVAENEGYDRYYQENSFPDKTTVFKKLKFEIRAWYYERVYRKIKIMEQDEYYMKNILPQESKLSVAEQEYNSGDKYRLTTPKEMRNTVRNYQRYKKQGSFYKAL